MQNLSTVVISHSSRQAKISTNDAELLLDVLGGDFLATAIRMARGREDCRKKNLIRCIIPPDFVMNQSWLLIREVCL